MPRVLQAILVSCVALAAPSAFGQTVDPGEHKAQGLTRELETVRAPVEAPRLSVTPSLWRTSSPWDASGDARRFRLAVPAHAPGAPSPFVSFADNPVADYFFRARPVTGWTWVSLGLGSASVGLAAFLFQAAGVGYSGLLPRNDALPASTDPLNTLSSYSLNYQNLGSLSLQAGLGALSSNFFRILYAPRDRSTARYMRTYVSELQGGWMFGFLGTL